MKDYLVSVSVGDSQSAYSQVVHAVESAGASLRAAHHQMGRLMVFLDPSNVEAVQKITGVLAVEPTPEGYHAQ